MPILSGIIQVDETFVRESQKGSRHLKSMVAQTEERKSRYGRQSSKFGVIGSEFATVVIAIENRGFWVCKVASLGKLSTNVFYELFHDHLDSPAFLCSDANNIYEEYCCVNNTPHFIRPSNFLKIIGNHGYIIQATDEFEKKANKKILEHLYYEGITDKITKRFINRDMTNVSTKYLQDYIGYFTYIRNWRVEHGHSPTSKADAEAIFTEILKTKKNLTSVEVRQKELILPKPSSRYMEVLKEETEKARTAIDNPYFKFNEEDSIFSFNKREYLLDLPKSRLFEIAKDRSQLIAEEDLEVMKSSRYVSKIR
nr:insertion element protein [Streptococcus mutans]